MLKSTLAPVIANLRSDLISHTPEIASLRSQWQYLPNCHREPHTPVIASLRSDLKCCAPEIASLRSQWH